MTSIRLPVSAVPLLSFCKGHGANFIFKTHADLIGLLAAYGFRLVSEGSQLPKKLDYAANITPVGIEVFENRGIYTNFLIMALASGDRNIDAADEEAVAKYVEKLVHSAASELNCIPIEHFTEKICQLLAAETNQTSSNIQI